MHRAAVDEAWRAGASAASTNDDRGLVELLALAHDIEQAAVGKDREEATTLASYLEHCRATPGGGGSMGALLERMLRRTPGS